MARSRRSKDAPSEFFAGFTDVDEIGSGSIATVFSAQAHGTGRHVALKLVALPHADPNLIAAAERELAAVAPLTSHPGIVTLLRTFRLDDGRLVLVLELCQGSLRDRLRDGRGLPGADVLAAGVTIGRALDAAHRARMLHRDVTPGNIMITAAGEPALGDFGLAGLRPPASPSLDGAVHTAPELLERRPATPASDVYGLASSLYQLIAGQPAFRAYAGESPAAMVPRILREPVPRLAVATPAVAELLLRGMAKDPAARPASAAAFADELAAAVPGASGSTVERSFRSLPAGMPPQPPPAPRIIESDWSAPRLSQPAVKDPVPAPSAEPTPKPADPEPPPPPPPPSDATVARGSLQRVPEAPPPGVEQTVLRSTLPGVPPAYPRPAPPRQMPYAGPVALDPSALARRVTLRSGRSSMVVDETGLTLRALLRKKQIAWNDVSGFDPRYDDPTNPTTGGHLVAVTRNGPVELPATKRAMADLRYTQALLEAYRLRAQAASGY